MKKIVVLIMGLICITNYTSAQEIGLKKIKGKGILTSDEIYIDNEGERYAKVFYITFKEHITKDNYQVLDIDNINLRSKYLGISEVLIELKAQHGLQEIERIYPEVIPNDTVRFNKYGKRIIVTDLSKRYRMRFHNLQSYSSILAQFKDIENIEYIEPPEIIYATSSFPNDPHYDLQWTLKLLEADKIFEITSGSPDIVLGISDFWTNNSTHGVHEELNGKILAAEYDKKYVPGVDNNNSHGPRIAAIAAAKNNNGKGIASLGSSFKLVTSGLGEFSLAYLRDICDGSPGGPTECDEFPDVVNMSWVTSSQSSKDVIRDLLSMGVVVVGASVNTLTVRDRFGNPDPWPGQSTWGEPFVPYPASFNYPDSAFQVIAVTATQLTDNQGVFDVSQPINPFNYEERFRFENYGQSNESFFNYGLSNDPLSNATTAFTDIAAPSARIFTANGVNATNDYGLNWGATSEAAPLVTSLVGILLSVNPDLGVREIYDIVTKSTVYNGIVVPPGTSTFNHPDGIRKYNKYIGYGRVNAYQAVVAAVPKKNNDINSPTTWSGYVHLENSVNVYDDLTILPGTTILLDDNVSLLIRPGAKLIAEGTEADPIRFIRGDADNNWNKISLLSSSGNSIKWALFDGGYINLSIASKNNTIEHSTFRNASFRTIEGWHNQDGSGNASATISHSLVENSASVGIVAQYLDLNLNNTTIQNNNQDGLYVTAATIFPFYENLITNNGLTITSRDGARILPTGTFYMLGASYDEGYNEISNNAHNQIENYGDTIVGAALGGSGGYNSVKGNYSGSNYLVANYGSPVNSVGTWWGQTTIDLAMFTGTVSGTHLTSDPTTTPGNDGESPAKAVFKEEIDFNQLFEEAEEMLSNANNSDEIQIRFHHLYQLEGLANKPDITDRFQNLARLATQEINTPFSNQSLTNTYQELALILYTKSLIRNENYSEAQLYIDQINSTELSEENKREFLDLRLVTETYHGKYEKALSTLDELYAQYQAKGVNLEEAQSRYSPIREDIIVRLNNNDRSPLKETITEEDVLDQIGEFTLHQNYPNPFNPVTNISFTLPERGFVSLKVYDILGREVANLVNEVKSIGTHSVNFNASFLSSGIYMYKLEAGQKVFSKRMTLIK